MKLSTLIEEVVAPHRNFGVAINVAVAPGEAAEPVGGRNPAILYGLGNLLENAVDFAHERVEVAASWSGQDVAVTITDDGPGFAPEIMDRIGEPYVTNRRRQRRRWRGERPGTGLFHRQDPAGTLRRDARLQEPRISAIAAQSSACAGAAATSKAPLHSPPNVSAAAKPLPGAAFRPRAPTGVSLSIIHLRLPGAPLD